MNPNEVMYGDHRPRVSKGMRDFVFYEESGETV